jgi:glycosyltransferase involved in cell wall biosynthesis
MKMLGLMRVKNEARWLEACLRAQWFCDHIIILDDNSTDETDAVCREFDGFVTLIHKSYDAGYDEGPDREFLAAEAAKYSPEWICSMDGDEVLLEDTWERIQPALEDPAVPAIDVLNLHLWNDKYTVRVDGDWRNQYRQRFWRFPPGKLTYEKDHCSIPNELIQRPFARLGVRMLHYGNIYSADRRRRYDRYVECGHDWPNLIQGDAGGPPVGDMELVPIESLCAKS